MNSLIKQFPQQKITQLFYTCYCFMDFTVVLKIFNSHIKGVDSVHSPTDSTLETSVRHVKGPLGAPPVECGKRSVEVEIPPSIWAIHLLIYMSRPLSRTVSHFRRRWGGHNNDNDDNNNINKIITIIDHEYLNLRCLLH